MSLDPKTALIEIVDGEVVEVRKWGMAEDFVRGALLDADDPPEPFWPDEVVGVDWLAVEYELGKAVANMGAGDIPSGVEFEVPLHHCWRAVAIDFERSFAEVQELLAIPREFLDDDDDEGAFTRAQTKGGSK